MLAISQSFIIYVGKQLPAHGFLWAQDSVMLRVIMARVFSNLNSVWQVPWHKHVPSLPSPAGPAWSCRTSKLIGAIPIYLPRQRSKSAHKLVKQRCAEMEHPPAMPPCCSLWGCTATGECIIPAALLRDPLAIHQHKSIVYYLSELQLSHRITPIHH